MKTIGLLGGTSWPSTPDYYTYLNRETAKRLGGHHAAPIILYSIDYHPIKSLYGQPDAWDKIPGMLARELSRLIGMKPDMILICNNTLHKGYDLIKDELKSPIPVVHIVESTGAYAARNGFKRMLLLGTKFSMEDGFFADTLRGRYGLTVDIPAEEDRNRIQEIQTSVSAGRIDPAHRVSCKEILARYPDYDAVILACTELPMVVFQEDIQAPLINTVRVQCDEALSLAFGGQS